MRKESKQQSQNDIDLTMTLFIIGGIILTVAAALYLAFSAGILG